MQRILLGGLVLLLAASAQAQEQEGPTEVPRPRPEFRTVPWAAWVAVGTTFDDYSVSVGLRREAFGAAFGFVRSFAIEVPAHSTSPAPNGGTEEEFNIQKVGLDLILMSGMTDWLSGYASVGGFVEIRTVLVRDSVTGERYTSPRHPDWKNPKLEFGGGLELVSLSPLLIGLGYHGARGFNVHVGYTW